MEFVEFLKRIKQELDLKKNKDVASFLGMEEKAFSIRKKRNSIPVEAVQAAAFKHPELKVDWSYILTGERAIPQQSETNTPTLKISSFVDLSDEECELLDIFRQLGKQNRQALTHYAQAMLLMEEQEKKETEIEIGKVA